MSEKVTSAFCTTPAAMRYWAIAFLIFLVPLTIASIYWHPLGTAAIPLAVGLGCIANWVKNRSYHCSITAPVFILGGAALLLASLGLIHAKSILIWALILAGTAVAFFLETRYARQV